jgi:hypothetical protein
MSKTAASVVAALVLVAVSAGVAATRRYVLGPEIDGPRGAGAWRVTLSADGRLADKRRPVTLTLPPDFRHQHIFQERFRSKELAAHQTRRKQGAPRKAQWRPRGPEPVRDYRLQYSFYCLLPIPQPTPAMGRVTTAIDAPPQPRPPSGGPDADEVVKAAHTLVREESKTPRDRARACFDFVGDLGTDPSYEDKTARECLRDGSGDSAGKARLLASLCRALGIPARVLSGLVLAGASDRQPLHHWVEGWIEDLWLPMDPTHLHFGSPFPANYLVLRVGDHRLVTAPGGRPELHFGVEPLVNPAGLEAYPGSPAQRFWRRLSLHGLRPGEQHLVKFLLLLPLSALIVSIFRTVIGVPTFGTFSPALLGLAFLDAKSLRWGLPTFVALVLMGWGMRHWLERLHLLQVPRASALLTMIVVLLIFLILAAGNAGIATTQYISLFPLVILTHLVERFWTLEAEDGPMTSFKTLLGTALVAVVVSLCLAPDAVAAWMFRYPETLGVVLGSQFLLGRYTGYRLTELYRFGELLSASAEPRAAVGDLKNGQPPPADGQVQTARSAEERVS